MVDYTEPLPAAKIRRLRVAQGLVLLFHITGFVGLAFSKNPEFYLRFTPLTLLLTAALLFAFEREQGVNFWGFCFSVSLLGFAAEVIGVLTGRFFGHYSYGQTLGYQVSGVPLAIGLNWLVLTYVCGHLARYLPLSELPRTILAALLMVGFDLCIEPVASQYHFWHWTADVIPLQNFRDWFIFSCVLQMLFSRAHFTRVNPLVPLVYLTQLLFFFLLGTLS
ncbi:carotenoid biosynthesis protein [Hymenobacter sp. BT664]|uniref:Carotenoid biosynthesis protein n=1 Tax=Hymenobacter montanus TaxID=2771359 RepID=A0A927BG54_9BACT|nr:carotenoid biosynthesis protein [Hymenobacter montanus]MBD2770272.1 carotenoid biosynthesis protein [Hymenobacter montanus]